jgi:hypothetical protein
LLALSFAESDWDQEQHLAMIAQLERALLLESEESLQVNLLPKKWRL